MDKTIGSGSRTRHCCRPVYCRRRRLRLPAWIFIPKRNRLALLSNSTDDNIGFTLNRHCDEAAFLKRLGDIIEMSRHNRSDGNELSQREIDVLCLLAKGLTNKEIADRLFISINTVLTHRKNISAKLGIRSISGLSVYAIMNGYITDIPDI